MNNIGLEKLNGILNVAVINDGVVTIGTDIPEGKIAYGGKPLSKKLRQLLHGQWRAVFKKLELPVKPDIYLPNHLCQAANAFQQSQYDESYIIVANALGEWEGVSIWQGWYENGRACYSKIYTKKYPYSLGLMYSAVTQYLGYEPNKDEGIVMKLSESGTARFNITYPIREKLWSGSYHKGCEDLRKQLIGYSKEDIAASVQSVLELELVGIKNKIPRGVQICFGGGVSYNTLAAKYVSRDVFIPKYAHSAALGAAAFLYGKKFKV